MPLASIEGLPDFGCLRGTQALAVKRFDRGHNRVHMEDFAQMYGVLPGHKYDGVSFGNIMSMIWSLTGKDGLEDFVRRLVFMIVIGNGDMHLKNWSFLYKDSQVPTLSPAYDLLSTVLYIKNETLALKLLKSKKMPICHPNIFEKLAQKSGVPVKLVKNIAAETMALTQETWAKNKHNYDLPAFIYQAIDRHIYNIIVL